MIRSILLDFGVSCPLYALTELSIIFVSCPLYATTPRIQEVLRKLHPLKIKFY